MLKQQTKLRVRLYARLSKDDGDADKESNSITNQLQMLRYNAKEKGFEVIGEYVDDGYSGTTFNRPDLNRMIKDAMDDPEPSGIMVKDMSRFGRNNAMFMYYVEEIFPNNDILFIALNDDVDTRFDENEMMPFKSIMNEYYARDTWIIVRNTHEAIIDEETFELVQKFISVKKQPNKTGRPNIFVGLVKCPDCGRNMAFSNPNGREPRFRCRTYVRNSNLCTTHAISYEALQQIVMSDIQKHIKNMEALGDQFIQEMHELSEKGGSKKIKQFEKDLEVAEKRIAEIDSVIMKLFEQNALGKISDERFEKMSSAYESEQKELAQKRDELRTKIRAEEKKTQSTNQFLETIRKYETVTELNRSMLVELIDSIYVYQAEGTGKDRKQRVEINYRFLAGSQCGIA